MDSAKMTNTNTRPDFMEPLPKRRKMSDPTPIYALRVRVFENNIEAVLSHYTEPELFSLKQSVSELFTEPFGSDTRIFFSTELVDLEDSEDEFGCDMVVTCHMDIGLADAVQIPIPKEWLKRTICFGFRGTDKEYNLVGDRLPIRPLQLGISPWGNDVRVQFVNADDE